MGRKDFDIGSRGGGDIDEAGQAMSQISAEAAALAGSGKVDADTANKRNELLWNINAQIDDTRVKLEQVEETQKELKKHLAQLQSLRKILAR